MQEKAFLEEKVRAKHKVLVCYVEVYKKLHVKEIMKIMR